MGVRAVVLSEPGPVENLVARDLPVPEPPPGWVRIRVRAAGVNRSELHTRLGLASGVTFPRVPGIEAVGVVDLDPDGTFRPGQQVATMMGGMGRQFIRGGTSALGMAATALALRMGATVLATTRNPDRLDALAAHGVAHPIVDDGSIAGAGRLSSPTASTPPSS